MSRDRDMKELKSALRLLDEARGILGKRASRSRCSEYEKTAYAYAAFSVLYLEFAMRRRRRRAAARRAA